LVPAAAVAPLVDDEVELASAVQRDVDLPHPVGRPKHLGGQHILAGDRHVEGRRGAGAVDVPVQADVGDKAGCQLDKRDSQHAVRVHADSVLVDLLA
jgi:hypothetical protein